MKIKFYSLASGILLMCCFSLSAQTNPELSVSKEWMIKNPFKSEVFIENKGQFTIPEDKSSEEILYAISNGDFHVYFTQKGVSYHVVDMQMNEESEEAIEEMNEMAEEDLRETGKINYSRFENYHVARSALVNIEWVNANPDAKIIVSEPVSDYYTYSREISGNTVGITAHAFKQLTYKNLYPNINVDFYFLQNGTETGVEYRVVVYPGGDLSNVKMKYNGQQNLSLNSKGDLLAAIPAGAVISRAPALCYEEKSGKHIDVEFSILNQTVSFKTDNYDRSQTLVVDPFTTIWNTNPNFNTNNQGLTVRADYAGNVYVGGGGRLVGGAGPPNRYYELKKFSPAGALLWTWQSPSIFNGWYGDFIVTRAGTALVGYGLGSNNVYKLSSAGTQILAKYTNNEPWRLSYNMGLNNNLLYIAGGSLNGVHLYKTDTNLTTTTTYGPWNSTNNNEDGCYLAQDKTGSFVYSTIGTKYGVVTSATAPFMAKVSTAAMATATWLVRDPSRLQELGEMSYANSGANPPSTSGWSAGLNGMTVCGLRVYTYDGRIVRAWSTLNGAITDSVLSGGSFDKHSGIAADGCCRIYIGYANAVLRYNSSLVYDTSIPAAGDVYDVILDPQNDSILYVTGNGFVQKIIRDEPVCSVLPHAAFTLSDTTFCNEGGSCIDFFDHSTNGPTNWQWKFPGAQPDTSSMQNPSGICYYLPGTYDVTLTVSNSSGADSSVVKSLVVFGLGAAAPLITRNGDTLFCSHEAAYQWYFNGTPIPGATDSFYVAIQDGTYNVYITDDIGCSRLGNTVTFVSVNDIAGGSEFAIYPNPAGGWFEVSGLKFEVNSSLQIFNVLGENVYNQQLQSMQQLQSSNGKSQTFKVDISSFAKGVYIVQLKTEEKTFRARVIKQ